MQDATGHNNASMAFRIGKRLTANTGGWIRLAGNADQRLADKARRLTSPLQILAGNLAVVALFVLGWAHARYWLRHLPGRTRAMIFGLVMGCGTVATMMMAAEIGAGRLLDLRATLLVLSAFFGGPLAAILTTTLAIVYRATVGGAGVAVGMALIVAVTVLGLVARWLWRRQQVTNWHMLGLGLGVMAINLATALAWGSTQSAKTISVMVAMATLNLVGTTLSGMVLVQARRFAAERDLLAAALSQAPDYNYVKDVRSRFAAVNLAVAQLHGVSHPSALLGKTDFDIEPAERAMTLFSDEQQIMRTGEAKLDTEELLTDRRGVARWFHTSKVPLYNGQGQVIGLAGVTRDVTSDRQLGKDLTDSRDLLSYALTEMSDGLAMFDQAGCLVFCNDQYRASFPYTAEMRQPGIHITEILRKVIETREQNLVATDDPEAWIAEIAANLNRESEEEISLFDGRWLQLRTRPTPNGSTMVVVSDITRIKLAELALHSATDQLKYLVRTDSLTGLLNRRAFDDTIESEVRRTARNGTALSLLIIDIDRFKAFNDHYGHPAGDACLQRVAELLRNSFKRPADSAARYGGEEFAAILPDTDEDGAYLVADAFRKSLAAAQIAHQASERGFVTASVGVATYMPDNLHRSTAEIILAADEMLYGAKAAGRDRVLGTRISTKGRRYAAG